MNTGFFLLINITYHKSFRYTSNSITIYTLFRLYIH